MPLGDFSPQAAAYSRSRPGYPPELVDLLAEAIQVRPGDPVVDVGAGTGLFTHLLANRGYRVTAIEPNEDMRRRAEPRTGVLWRHGTFEDTRLPDASQRWAVAAQSFHWANPDRALPELRRILQEPGWLTVLWNNRANERSDLLAWTTRAIHRHVPGFDQSYRNSHWDRILVSTGDFSGPLHHSLDHVVPMTRERYLDLWRSNNQLAEAAGPEGLAAFLGELAAYLSILPEERLEIPYVCEAWTVRTAR